MGGFKNIDLSDLANWDGRHFLEIAQRGYTDKIQYAFFPLFPFLVNLISRVLNVDYIISGILINFLSSFGIIYTFLRLLKEYREKHVLIAMVYFLIFPTSFYLITIYSESLFLFCALSAFLFAKKKKYFWAGIFVSLAAATRITGIAVILGLLADVFLSKTKTRDKIAVILLAPLGLILYCVFLYLQTGNPFYFLTSEINWGRTLTLPGTNIWETLRYISYFGLKPESYTILSDLLFAIFGIGMGIRALRFLKAPLKVYTICALILPLATGLLLSIPRFLVVLFPMFILIAKVNKRVFHISYVIISLVLLFLYFNFFLRNIWVS